MFKKSGIFAIICLLILSIDIQAQENGETIYSMGVPSRYEFSLGPMFVIDQQQDETRYGGQIYANLYRHLHSPLFGIGIAGEGYVQYLEDDEVDGGARLFGTIRPIFLSAGIDYAFKQESLDFILSLNLPLRRSGLFGNGSTLRADWIPGKDHTFNVGINIPIGEPFFGKARPKSAKARLPKATKNASLLKTVSFSPKLQQSLDTLNHAAEWMNRYTTPYFDQANVGDAATKDSFMKELTFLKTHLELKKDEQYPDGHSFPAEIEMYHRMFNQTFTLALAKDSTNVTHHEKAEGMRIATQARDILFHSVLLPYNRLSGLSKSPDSVKGLAVQALKALDNWLAQSTQLDAPQHSTVLAVFDAILETIETQRKIAKALWKDSELVWLPFQYALRPNEYDDREEMNALLEEIAGKSFSHANRIHYVINEQFQQEVAKMIVLAEDYHVLWIHDYRGVNAAGEPDSVSFRQTLIYLQALTERVRKYDEVGKLPAYLILIDQYFFELNDRRWIEFLGNPLRNTMRFSEKYADWDKELREAQDALRQAVADSKLLQEQAQKYGKKWLEKTVKVHVNITNPADHSFRNAQMARFIPFIPDNLMRDHRKISFYDVTELDPGKGEALYSGMGVGEQYVGATWDDRAMLVQGPVILSLKNEARNVLKQQGFTDEQIPPPLKPLPFPENYDDMLEALRQQGWSALAMDVHNHTGFQSKDLNVVKSALFTLMPPGSSIILPDGYWNAQLWGGMLTGAALRGCRIFLVAPAPENSTFSTATMLLSRTQVLFSRLVMMHNEFADALEAVGGTLKTGIYSRKSALGTIESIDELMANFDNTPFIKEWLPFDDDVYEALETTLKNMIRAGYQPTYYSDDAEDRKTKLHYKVNLFISKPVHKLMRLPGWGKIIRGYLQYRMKFLARGEGEYVDMTDTPEELRKSFEQTVEAFLMGLSDKELQQAMAYLIVGSQNHNYRSIITDGEMGCLVSGISALLPVLDIFFMSGLTTWVTDLEELERLLPEQSGFLRWVGRYIRKVM